MVKKKTKVKVKESEDYTEKKSLLIMQSENTQKKHEMKMKELKYQRDTDRVHHDLELERQRIRSAEIQKTLARKEHSRKYTDNNRSSNNSFYQP